MKKFRVTYFLDNEIIAHEVAEFEDAKHATIRLGNSGQYRCTDEKGIYYCFRLSDVKMITAEEIPEVGIQVI